MSEGTTLLPDPDRFQLICLEATATAITAVVATKAPSATCPLCGKVSTHLHSRYVRSVADLPWRDIPFRLRLHVRRFFCDEPSCPRVSSRVLACPRVSSRVLACPLLSAFPVSWRPMPDAPCAATRGFARSASRWVVKREPACSACWDWRRRAQRRCSVRSATLPQHPPQPPHLPLRNRVSSAST